MVMFVFTSTGYSGVYNGYFLFELLFLYSYLLSIYIILRISPSWIMWYLVYMPRSDRSSSSSLPG
jgi:hypothetical protein